MSNVLNLGKKKLILPAKHRSYGDLDDNETLYRLLAFCCLLLSDGNGSASL